MKILSLAISVLSIVVGLIVMIGCFFTHGKVGMSEGAAAWIIITLGAPTTFLVWLIDKIGLSKGVILEYIWVCLFYLLQYQLVAFFIYYLYKKNVSLFSLKAFTCVGVIVVVIVISAVIMWNIVMGNILL